MLQIRPTYFALLDDIEAQGTAAGVAELGKILQGTLRLEHATIPPYLTAAYSLNRMRNRAVRELIVRIAKEEMLHMVVVANLMNAIGVPPRLDQPDFIPAYPAKLPMLEADGFEVSLTAFSTDIDKNKQLIEGTFMRIEKPEDPGRYPDLDVYMTGIRAEPRPRTIGALYERIINIIESNAIDGLFANAKRDAYKQIVRPSTDAGDSGAALIEPRFKRVQVERDGVPQAYAIPQDIDFRIVDAETAVRHLRWVVDQGEGTDKQPIDAKGLPAHYYRFESMLFEEYLVQDPDFDGDEVYDGGFSFSGAELRTDQSGVHEFDSNPKLDDYDGPLRDAMERFQLKYGLMLDHLHRAFNCMEDTEDARNEMQQHYESSITAMIALSSLARKVKREANRNPQNRKGGLPFTRS